MAQLRWEGSVSYREAKAEYERAYRFWRSIRVGELGSLIGLGHQIDVRRQELLTVLSMRWRNG